MNRAKEQILARLKQAPRDANSFLPKSPLASVSLDEDPQDLFVQKCLENKIEVHAVTQNSWRETLLDIAKERSLKHWLLGNELAEIDNAEQVLSNASCETFRYERQIETCKDFLFDQIDASFTLAHAAIAETGTLILWPSANEPRLMSLLPPVHIVLLEVQQIQNTMQSFVSSLGDELPTNLLFISSPSKTADIQQTLAYGAHGPKELIVLLRS